MDLNYEKEIIEKCKSDLTFFSIIYKSYAQDVFRYCYSKLDNRHEAEEQTSLVFLTALENIQKYTYQGKTIKCWLYIIARNNIYKSYRLPDEITLDESWQGAEDDSILDEIADRQIIEQLEKRILEFNPP